MDREAVLLEEADMRSRLSSASSKVASVPQGRNDVSPMVGLR